MIGGLVALSFDVEDLCKLHARFVVVRIAREVLFQENGIAKLAGLFDLVELL